MILKKLMVLVFLVGAFFTINSLSVQARSTNFCDEENNFFALFEEEGCCLVRSSNCGAPGDKPCCKNLTCQEPAPGYLKTCN